ncbi:transposase [Shigella boydii]|uniref:IS1 encoded protein n=2 Tax=Shigella TaxID=620 RepID=Q326L5_SHIBS|nr:putative IS1 encoded protein [Shigella boydii Sb227]EIQ02409.1 putative IS1 encoded protein [Shigella flexneri CCH060]OUZ86660.1 transposase [Shigella flexneri]PHU97657.1 transposase [Shigella boydii]PNP04960.1 transposase [Shigella flexneri]
MRAEIALMSGSAFAVTHHAFSSGAGRTSDGNGSHASTLKSPSYTKSVSWQHYHGLHGYYQFDRHFTALACGSYHCQ